jgi:hypothetical protein
MPNAASRSAAAHGSPRHSSMPSVTSTIELFWPLNAFMDWPARSSASAIGVSPSASKPCTIRAWVRESSAPIGETTSMSEQSFARRWP